MRRGGKLMSNFSKLALEVQHVDVVLDGVTALAFMTLLVTMLECTCDQALDEDGFQPMYTSLALSLEKAGISAEQYMAMADASATDKRLNLERN